MRQLLFRPLNPERLSSKAIRQIEDLINNGVLKPGDRLPSEREMSSQLKVSRSVLREALKTLECLGYIYRKPGGGTFVRDITEWNHGVLLTDLMKRAAYLDYLEAREMLEQKIVELVIERASQEELEDIDRFISKYETEAPDARAELMLQFHYKLASLTKNVVLLNFMLINWELHKSFSLAAETKPDPSRWKATIEEHKAILEAIKQRNVRKAQQAVLDHLRAVRLHRQTVTSTEPR